jgi:methionine synthase I (cobalamin-dependent)
MSVAQKLRDAASERILIKDGPFGTEIQNWKLAEADYAGSLALGHDQKGNNDILAMTKPEVPEAITRAYLDAGADVIATNTFSANRISQADYGAEHLVGRDQPRLGRDRAALRRRICGARWAGRASSPGAGAHQQDAVAVAGRQRSGLSRGRFRRRESRSIASSATR